jgi:hypothetical protein
MRPPSVPADDGAVDLLSTLVELRDSSDEDAKLSEMAAPTVSGVGPSRAAFDNARHVLRQALASPPGSPNTVAEHPLDPDAHTRRSPPTLWARSDEPLIQTDPATTAASEKEQLLATVAELRATTSAKVAEAQRRIQSAERRSRHSEKIAWDERAPGRNR